MQRVEGRPRGRGHVLYIEPTHTVVPQKLTQHCKAIIHFVLFLFFFFNKNDRELTSNNEFYLQLYPASKGYEDSVD